MRKKTFATKQKKPQSDKNSTLRVKGVFLLLFVAASVLTVRLYNLQVERGPYYAALAVGQQGGAEQAVPPRGNIYFQDKAGESRYLAATNKEVPLVYAVPKEVDDPEFVLNSLAGILSFDEPITETLFQRLNNQDSSYALIARKLTDEQARTIKDLKIKGVYVTTETVRFYPGGNIAAQILGFYGFSGDERRGQYGVEQYYESELSGEARLFSSAQALLLGKQGGGEAADIELTIDYGVQFMLEQKLRERVEAMGAQSASAVFMDPKTGAIIAMASVPTFNPNTYFEAENISVFTNDAVQSVYELGSVFKPLTMAAAIDGGAITPQTVYEDTGAIKIGGYTITNSDKKSHGQQTMAQGLEKSLNTAVIFAQNELGKKRFAEYMDTFLLDKQTGIDLPGEAQGDLRNLAGNNDINFATAAFGQGIAMSPLRLISSLSAIANGGTIMRPYVVKSIAQDGNRRETQPEEVASPISPTTASRVTAMMVGVTERGSGTLAAIPGYAVATKTGTAQVPSRDGSGYSSETIHSVVGFAPAYNPRFIGIITMQHPTNARFAATSTGPLFGEISSYILQYYKVPPQ